MALLAFGVLTATYAGKSHAQGPTNLKPLVEDCVAVDPQTVSAADTSGTWRVGSNAPGALDFGADSAEAQRAVEVIQHYHFTQECFIRRPHAHMMYWKNGVAIPPGNMPGQDCITLRPEAIVAAYVADGWKVLDGDNWILDFGPDRAAADQAAAVIRAYSLNRECFIARPHVTMQYWLAE